MPEIPQNGQFMVAAYIVAAVIYLSYSLTLYLRARSAASGKR